VPVNLTITCDTAAELVDEFRKLNTLTTEGSAAPNVNALLASMPINDFMDIANAKLRPQGFKIVVDEPPVIEAPEPEPAPEKPKKARKSDLEVLSNVEELPSPRQTKKDNGADPMDTLKDLASDPGEDPEGDRQFVLDTLAGMLKGKRKDKVLEFTGRQAQLHGAEKISALPAEPFVSIRREMEKVFPDVKPA
jgi:hypothetical protein